MPPRLPPELSVGYEEIDGQHRHLMRFIEAATGSLESDDRARTAIALAELGDYLVAHFSSEESLMAQSGYPDRARHKAAHDIFMQDFMQLSQELAASGLTPLVRQWIVARVPEWIRFHIQANDVALGAFLSARKFSPASMTDPATKPRAS